MRRIIFCAALLAAASACSSDPLEPPEGFAFAYAEQGCTPVDGSALWLSLTGTATDEPRSVLPRVDIAIYRPIDEVAGQTWVFGGDGDIGSAYRCYDASNCVPGVISRVTIRRIEADSTVVGEATLRFGDGTTVNGGFRAVWLHEVILCG